MSSNTTHEFVAPVGGVPYPIDFAPSILFSILYGLLIPTTIRCMVNPGTRQFVLIGTLIFGGVERVVSFSLRAAAARDASVRNNEGILTYLQTDYSGGFISVGQDLVIVVRALLVNATLGSDMIAQYELDDKRKKDKFKKKQKKNKNKSDRKATELAVDSRAEEHELSPQSLPVAEGTLGLADHPRMRYWVRRACDFMTIVWWVSVILGIVAGSNYKNAVDSRAHAVLVQRLWYGSTGLALFAILALPIGATWAGRRIPRVPQSAVLWVVLVASLLCVVAVYRLVVMQYTTTSLFSTAPHSGNQTGAKVAFYLLQVVPEFLAIAILTVLNVRRVFNTGLWGDRRSKDPLESS